jgi:phosphoribosylformimino-5-aminoimidazole carboxamide ribotide isomerase
MTIYPAIDLKANRAVRLTKGEMASAKVYAQNPADQAIAFEKMGAEWLHIVDLDGAFAGHPKNGESIEAIRAATAMKLQLGGGIRSEETIKAYLDLGIDRVILGSAAAKDPQWAIEMATRYPVVIGIDAVEGKVATAGWAEVGKETATAFAARFKNSAVQAVITTDVGRDGTLSGVNVDFTLSIKEAFCGPVIASGGVKDLADLKSLKATGRVDGAIVGKAFYEGRLDIKEAFNL